MVEIGRELAAKEVFVGCTSVYSPALRPVAITGARPSANPHCDAIAQKLGAVIQDQGKVLF